MKKNGVVIILIILLLALGTLIYYIGAIRDVGEADARCSLEPEAGTCLARFERYYFDSNEGVCKQFYWGGCGGVVPFETIKECRKACE